MTTELTDMTWRPRRKTCRRSRRRLTVRFDNDLGGSVYLTLSRAVSATSVERHRVER